MKEKKEFFEFRSNKSKHYKYQCKVCYWWYKRPLKDDICEEECGKECEEECVAVEEN